MPVKCALLPEIDVSDQQDGNVKHHFYEPKPPRCCVMRQILENVRPGIEEYSLNVEQDEDHRYQVKLDGKGLAGIPRGRHTTFIRLHLGLVWAAPSDQRGNGQQGPRECHSDKQVY